jgi:hypothetical protein
MLIYEYHELNSTSLHHVPKEGLLTLNYTQLILYEYKLSPELPQTLLSTLSVTLW